MILKIYLIYGNNYFSHKYDNNENNISNLIPVFNTKYKILFVHDFKDKSIENYDIIFEKYNRRINRFIEKISNINNNIIFVYKNYSTEYKTNIYNYWINFFDDKNIFNEFLYNINLCDDNNELYKLKDLIKNKYLNKNIEFIEENIL